MKIEIKLLRISYWTAAIADFCISLLVLIPERMGLTEIVYPMGLISAVAFSWGVLLIFADQKPLERRWILVPTMLVILLLSVVRIIFVNMGSVTFSYTFIVFGFLLIIFIGYSYLKANKLVEKE